MIYGWRGLHQALKSGQIAKGLPQVRSLAMSPATGRGIVFIICLAVGLGERVYFAA